MSALTLSPKKNAQLINELGMKYKVFIMFIIYRVILRRIKDMKDQLRCVRNMIFLDNAIGCVFAAMQQGIDFKEVNKSAKAF